MNRHFVWSNRLGNDLLVKVSSFSEMESDAAIDVCCRNVVDFFQSHTGFFIGVRSSGAGDCEHIGSLWYHQLLFGKRVQTEAFLFKCFRRFVFVELSAIIHDNCGT